MWRSLSVGCCCCISVDSFLLSVCCLSCVDCSWLMIVGCSFAVIVASWLVCVISCLFGVWCLVFVVRRVCSLSEVCCLFVLLV